jgi:capsular polysaccharide biosynthesis protein
VELRTYWSIIWRRIWIVALLVIVVGLYVGYSYYKLAKTPGALKAYSSILTVQVGLHATTSGDSNSADYVTAAETLADTFTAGPILTSTEFDRAVSNQISQDMSTIQQRFGANADLGNWQDTGAIGQALNATRVHALVTITVTWPTAAGAWAIANAVSEVCSTQLGNFLDYVVANNNRATNNTFIQPAVAARTISSPTTPTSVAGTSGGKALLLIVLLLVALLLGIALTFLLNYLDDRIYSKEQVTRLLGVPILGEIPAPPAPGRRGKP